MSEHDVSDFQAEVLDRSAEVPVVVDFWAEWCAPCRALGPIMEKLAGEAGGKWQLAKVDTEAMPEVGARYGIRSIPNVKLFVDGEVVSEFVGALPEEAVRQWLAEVLPGGSAEKLREAREALASGDPEREIAARRTLEEILGEEPGNGEALLLLAQSRLFEDPAGTTVLLETIPRGSPHDDLLDALRTVGGLLSLLTDTDALADSPAKQRYIEGITALAERDFEAALAAFVDVVGIDRNLDDDGARRAALAVFEILGSDSEIARDYRRRLSSALFS
jgi:putative thioredoxin